MVASTWPGDHQGRPSAPTISLDKLYTARYQVLHYITFFTVHAGKLLAAPPPRGYNTNDTIFG
jgi:hypothetical protein